MQLRDAGIIVGSIRAYTYDNNGHRSDNGKVPVIYVADNKMPQQMT